MTAPPDPTDRAAAGRDVDQRTGQEAFAAALFDPDAPPPADLALVGGRAPAKRFAVYRNNVVFTLIEALGEAYPAVKALVGEAFFNAAAGVYVRTHPPRSPLMMTYGEAFPEWIATFEPAAGLPYLRDVAGLERLLRESYHAAEAPALDGAGVAAATGGRSADFAATLRGVPHPAARVAAFEHPALAIWLQSRAAETEASLPAGGETVLIARPEADVTLHRLPHGGAAAWRALEAGGDLSAAAAAGAEAAGAAGFDFETWFGALVRAGALTRLDAPAQT